jgi:hypothetical protein
MSICIHRRKSHSRTLGIPVGFGSIASANTLWIWFNRKLNVDADLFQTGYRYWKIPWDDGIDTVWLGHSAYKVDSGSHPFQMVTDFRNYISWVIP